MHSTIVKYFFIFCLLSVSWQALATSTQSAQKAETVSLNFQQIPVRSVLQLLAEFTGKNVIISDAVKGNITLHLTDVPWQQALDYILQSQGLATREQGNIMIIAPQADIFNQEQNELKAQQQLQTLAPLQTESFQIHYGNVNAYYDMLKEANTSLLSVRGKVVKLATSNTLIVEDTAEKLQNIRQLFSKMDVPMKQILIEARLVFVNQGFQQNLGIKWGSTTASGANALNGFNMDLTPGVATQTITQPGTLAFGTLVNGTVLSLELQALELEGEGEVVSSPRVMTSNNVTASIEQGTQIPYEVTAQSGATAVQLVSAVLKLEVTPQITPNNKIILDLVVNQDKPEPAPAGGQPSINTRKLKTNILVENGQTIVLGGVYEMNKSKQVTRVPFLGSLPIIGNLFKQTLTVDHKSELLIFITPKIIDEVTQHAA